MTAACTTLADVLVHALEQDLAIEPAIATTLVDAMLSAAIRLGHGGTEYYLPGHPPTDRVTRNALIRAEFNGRNLRHICRKYAVSKTTVYRICRRGEG